MIRKFLNWLGFIEEPKVTWYSKTYGRWMSVPRRYLTEDPHWAEAIIEDTTPNE